MKLKSVKIGNYELKYPIIQGGMGLGISWDKLAGNVSLNGGLGVISSVGTGYYKNKAFINKEINSKPYGSDNFYSSTALKEIIKNAREICGNKALGVNIMCASTAFEESVKASCEAGINIIIAGAGLPTNLPEFTKGYDDVALVPIVSSAKALNIICKRWFSRYNKLPDAVVLEGPKSGGHQGFTYEQCVDPEFQLENLIPSVVDMAKEWGEKANKEIPVFAAGGIWDHKDIKDAINLGASGVQIGTRFIGTFECDAADEFKQVILNAKKDDIELIHSPVGYPARGIRTNLINLVEKKQAPNIQCISNCVSPCKRGIGSKKVGYCIADRLYDAYAGNTEFGLFFSGVNGYRLNEIISVKELFEKLINDENN